MSLLVVVNELSKLGRLYIPKTQKRLNETREQIVEARLPMTWGEERMREWREKYGKMAHPDDIGPIGTEILKRLSNVQGVNQIILRHDEVYIGIDGDYEWNVIEEEILKDIGQILGAQSVSRVSFYDWMRQFEPQVRLLIKTISTEHAVVREFWPPIQLTSQSGKNTYYRSQKNSLTQSGGLTRELQEFFKDVFEMDGIIDIEVEVYCLTIKMSPAFDIPLISQNIAKLFMKHFKLEASLSIVDEDAQQRDDVVVYPDFKSSKE